MARLNRAPDICQSDGAVLEQLSVSGETIPTPTQDAFSPRCEYIISCSGGITYNLSWEANIQSIRSTVGDKSEWSLHWRLKGHTCHSPNGETFSVLTGEEYKRLDQPFDLHSRSSPISFCHNGDFGMPGSAFSPLPRG